MLQQIAYETSQHNINDQTSLNRLNYLQPEQKNHQHLHNVGFVIENQHGVNDDKLGEDLFERRASRAAESFIAGLLVIGG